MCSTVADEERSCSVTASVVPSHIIAFSDKSKRICGTVRQPWTIEAPVGQRIRISLLDFSASRTDMQIKQSCHSYGVIVEKGRKRNVSICGGGAHRESESYRSRENVMEIVFNAEDHRKQNVTDFPRFMLRVEGWWLTFSTIR